MRMLRVMIMLLLVVCPGVAAPTVQSGMVVHVWQSQDGLPSNVVRSIAQSSDGYLWVATAEGIARFDGYEFELIEAGHELRRSRLAFSRLFTTTGGRVWAATYQGGLFRVSMSGIVRILENVRTPRPPMVTQVVESAVGEVFFKRGEEFGQIRAGDSVVGLSPTNELLELFELDMKRQKENGRVFDSSTNPELHDPAGSVWTVGASGELTVIDPGGNSLPVDFPQRGTAFGINEMMLDSEGNVWVSSPVNGLARLHHARVDMPEIDVNTSELPYAALIEDHSGAWWIASRRGGLVRWTPDETRHIEYSTAEFPRPAAALFEDRDSRLWVASRDGSVFLQENGVFLPQFVKTQVPSKVRSITQGTDATLWFGGTQGLASFAGGVVRKFGKAEGIGDLDITVLQPFPGGKIIAGSTSGTILLGDQQGFTTLPVPEIINHQWISGILVISAKEIWISTLGGGLLFWNGQQQWRAFGADDGLPDERLTCVLEDAKKNLWLGSLSGIIRVDPKELIVRLREPESAVHWLRLDHTDGLPSRECIGGFQPSGWRARDGRLWFPTGGGVVRVRPDLVERNTVAPPVFLQSVKANGVPYVGERGPVTMDPGRARMEFRFVGLSFSAPEKTTYRARLKGLDDAWRELGNQRIAAYEAVPPGKYTFEVMAVNGDGVRSAEPASISVMVRPHLWETPWFYMSGGALVLSGAAGTGWFASRQRLKARIQLLRIHSAREGERSRIARDLHDDLGASLTEISILSALAAEDAENSVLQPSLQQLSAKSKSVVSSLDEIVWAVNPREDTLRSLVEYLAAYAREYLDSARIPMRSEVDREIPDQALAASKRHSVFLAAREVLNNIVKHSGASEVMLQITFVDHSITILIQDNGKGFALDYAESGNGLGNLRSRMQEVGGDCRIETRLGRGTSVFLTLALQGSDKLAS